jgi:translocator protein
LALAGFIGLCLLVGVSDAAVTQLSVRTWYVTLHRPPGTPPYWMFGPVWAGLYAGMAVAAWLVWQRVGASRPLRLWGWQLIVNALWTPAFFGLRQPALALAVIALMVLLVAATTRVFWRVRRTAGALMLPYLAWACYATYLTAGFWWLNDA